MKKLLGVLGILLLFMTLSCKKTIGEHISDEGADAINETFFQTQSGIFDGTEGGVITIPEAVTQQERWKAQAQDTTVLGNYIGRDILEDILIQPEAVGITFYFAMNDSNQNVLTYVGTDQYGEDLLGGIVANMSSPYPCCWCGLCESVPGKKLSRP